MKIGQKADRETFTEPLQVGITLRMLRDLHTLRDATRVPTASRVRDAIHLILYEARERGELPPLPTEDE